MDCKEFKMLTKDFIFDDINNNKKIMEYIEHSEHCNECYEELEVTYSMFRSLGDVMGPDGMEYSSDYGDEIEQIKEYYKELYDLEKRKKFIILIAVLFIILILLLATVCFLYELA